MIKIEPIAYVKNTRNEVEDDYWGGVVSEIIFSEKFDASSLQGLEECSHLEIIFYFNLVDDQKIQYKARHPRNNKSYPEVGIFAQRGKNRPNKLGLTTVSLRAVQGKRIIVEGLDAIDGTPVLDIKPVMKEFLPRGEIKQPWWSTDLMQDYWKRKSLSDK